MSMLREVELDKRGFLGTFEHVDKESQSGRVFVGFFVEVNGIIHVPDSLDA
jgi:hypothetical protein